MTYKNTIEKKISSINNQIDTKNDEIKFHENTIATFESDIELLQDKIALLEEILRESEVSKDSIATTLIHEPKKFTIHEVPRDKFPVEILNSFNTDHCMIEKNGLFYRAYMLREDGNANKTNHIRMEKDELIKIRDYVKEHGSMIFVDIDGISSTKFSILGHFLDGLNGGGEFSNLKYESVGNKKALVWKGD